ncbi:MAG: DMT family transporter [Candidatus Methanoplasma sp.]|jgi:drug/metabolite transporter (DMT)-like permease|nr:DMT family transporter [Candidatus Methanoplasma sp.]
MNRNDLPYLLAFLYVCVVYGLNKVIVKATLDGGVPTFLLVVVTYGIGFLMFLPAKRIFKAPKISHNEWKYGALVGAVIFVAFALQTLGISGTTATNAGLFTSLYVIFIPIIIILIKKKFSARPLLLAVLSFIGIAVLTGISPPSPSEVLILGCALAYAAQFILLEKYSPKLNTINFTVVQLLVVSLISAVITLATETTKYADINVDQTWYLLAFAGLAIIGLGFFIQTLAQTRIPATTVSVMCCTEAVFGMIFGAWLLDEPVTAMIVIGAVIIVISTVLSAIFGQEKLIGDDGPDGHKASG